MRSDALRLARDIMNASAHALSPDTPARDAAVALARQGSSGAPVVDADGLLLGMVTDDEVIHTLAVAAYAETSVGSSVGDIMTTDIVTVDPKTDLFRLAEILHSHGLNRVPVVSDGHLVGIVAAGDVMRSLAEVCEERSAEHVLNAMDAIAQTEQMHNPFPGHYGRDL